MYQLGKKNIEKKTLDKVPWEQECFPTTYTRMWCGAALRSGDEQGWGSNVSSDFPDLLFHRTSCEEKADILAWVLQLELLILAWFNSHPAKERR